MRNNLAENQGNQRFCDMLELLDSKNFASKTRWEAETTKMVRQASEKTIGELGEYVQDARNNGWWGAVYENGVIAPYGLANYLAELYSFQIFALDIWNVKPEAQRPSRPIDEFHEERRAKFRFWLMNKYLPKMQHLGFPDLTAIERNHVEVIKSYGVKRHSETLDHVAKNPNLLKPFQN